MTMKTLIGIVVVTVCLLTRNVTDACSCIKPVICNKSYVISATVTSSTKSFIGGYSQIVSLDDVTVYRNSSAMDNLVMIGNGPCASIPLRTGFRYIIAGNDVQTNPESTVLDIQLCDIYFERVDNIDNIGGHVESELKTCGAKMNADSNKQQKKVKSFIKAALNSNDR